jgi:hypothetical protein
LDQGGVIYGTTGSGGNQSCRYRGEIGCGTAFKLTQKGGAWIETQIHAFTGGNDGATPNGGLVLVSKNSLYGTAGGGSKFGLVFRLSQLKHNNRWAESVLHNFSGGSDGRGPAGPLVLDLRGNLYGTVGPGPDYGGVFVMRPNGHTGWDFSVAYNFKGAPDGSFPSYSLIFVVKGQLYGTTLLGGSGGACSGGCGTVFEMSRQESGLANTTVGRFSEPRCACPNTD